MHALFNRLRVGGTPRGLGCDPEAAAELLQQADEALEAAQMRIAQLTEALQNLVDLSDATRPRNMAEVRRRLVHAQRLLSTVDDVAPRGIAVAPSTAVAPPAPVAASDPIGPSAPAAPPAPPPCFLRADEPDGLRADEPDGREADEEQDLERDLDNLKKILQASWAS